MFVIIQVWNGTFLNVVPFINNNNNISYYVFHLLAICHRFVRAINQILFHLVILFIEQVTPHACIPAYFERQIVDVHSIKYNNNIWVDNPRKRIWILLEMNEMANSYIMNTYKCLIRLNMLIFGIVKICLLTETKHWTLLISREDCDQKKCLYPPWLSRSYWTKMYLKKTYKHLSIPLDFRHYAL